MLTQSRRCMGPFFRASCRCCSCASTLALKNCSALRSCRRSIATQGLDVKECIDLAPAGLSHSICDGLSQNRKRAFALTSQMSCQNIICTKSFQAFCQFQSYQTHIAQCPTFVVSKLRKRNIWQAFTLESMSDFLMCLTELWKS